MGIRHEDLWRALDTLAAENGMTPSGLARAAGLDATTFNPSKRRSADGRPRWPSTESLSRALAATGATLESFTALVGGARTLGHARRDRERSRMLKVTRLGATETEPAFDETGSPAGHDWERAEAPPLAESGDYALRIETDAHEPVLARGDLVMVSPDAPIEEGDRVLACVDGEVAPARIRRQSGRRIELEPLGTGQRRQVERQALGWMHRITWIGR